MSDLINVQLGACPWQPTADVELLEVLSHYDAPLTGLIKQRGETYLFHCIFGPTDPRSVWIYVPLDSQDLKVVDELEGDEIDPWIAQLIDSRYITAAFATAKGIRQAVAVTGQRSLEDLTERIFQELEVEMRSEEAALEAAVRHRVGA